MYTHLVKQGVILHTSNHPHHCWLVFIKEWYIFHIYPWWFLNTTLFRMRSTRTCMCLVANERTQCISVWRSCTKRTWVFQDKFRKRSLKKFSFQMYLLILLLPLLDLSSWEKRRHWSLVHSVWGQVIKGAGAQSSLGTVCTKDTQKNI